MRPRALDVGNLHLSLDECREAVTSSREWLTDNQIALYLYLSCPSTSLDPSTSLLGPSQSSLLRAQRRDDEEVSDLLRCSGADGANEYRDAAKATRVICLVNNAQGFETTGSHWSTLVAEFATTPPRFLHFDSMRGANASAANDMAKCLLHLRAVFRGADSLGTFEKERIRVETGEAVQQSNVYDCGAFAGAFAAAAARGAAPALVARADAAAVRETIKGYILREWEKSSS